MMKCVADIKRNDLTELKKVVFPLVSLKYIPAIIGILKTPAGEKKNMSMAANGTRMKNNTIGSVKKAMGSRAKAGKNVSMMETIPEAKMSIFVRKFILGRHGKEKENEDIKKED